MYELKDFQKQTVDYIYERLLNTNCQRFLCADEVGLGKTIIAKGLIEKYLALKGGNLKVFYICSSQFLAQQNLGKLNPNIKIKPITRLTELITRPDLIKESIGLSILPLSPNTSVDIKSKGGKIQERVYLYRLIKESKLFSNRKANSFERVFGLNIQNWDYWLDRLSKENVPFDEVVSQNFIRELATNVELLKEIEDCFEKISEDYRGLIGKLRLLLATTALKSLKPDIIILDEFQRFSELLKQSESDDASDLINALFKNDDTEMLLLSATPYKMYTIRAEDEEDHSHYQEFHFLMKFLMRDDYDRFMVDWKNYTDSILSLRHYQPELIGELKSKVEQWLYKYMCRTERNIVYESDKSKTLIEAEHFELPFSSGDVRNFINADNIVKCIEQEHPEIYSPLEYCKTVPYPLSFMDEYKLKRLFREMYDDGKSNMKKCVKQNEAFINYDTINNYQLKEFNNAKLNWLAEKNVRPGANLLWVPPSIPYYKLSGPFENSETFSKLMIFGRFAVEPRAIATLASYIAELYSTGSQEATAANKEDKPRIYYSPESDLSNDDIDEKPEEKKKYSRIPRPRLNFKKGEMPFSLYCYYYPSLFLTSLVKNTLEINSNQSSFDLLKKYEEKINEKLIDLNKFVQRKSERTDVRWYLFSLLFLDYSFNKQKFAQIDLVSLKKFILEKELHVSLNQISEYIGIIVGKGPDELAKQLDLGDIPQDLSKVLSVIAMGSPANLSFLTLLNAFQTDDSATFNQSFAVSFSIANAFRSYFNQPESISIVDVSNQGEKDYWLATMQYCISGCLISVLDECFYMHCDGNYMHNETKSAINDFSDYLSAVLSLRTASLTIDMVNSEKKVIQKSMRTHYALAFMDQLENEDTLSRKDSVQSSFNSPFRPFILATTSIGQEGLDFHKYCRQLMHWSLPGNAIDLEQREGRINRYKHFALRKNLVSSYTLKLEGEKIDKSIWKEIFNIAENDHQLRGENCQLVPFWHVPRVSVPLERIVLTYPYSKDVQKLDHLLKTLTVYRMSLGQPNQEDLVRFLLNNFTAEELEVYKAKLIINLSPVAYEVLRRKPIQEFDNREKENAIEK